MTSGLSTSYTDPRLTAVYDALNPRPRGFDFYVPLAGTAAKTVLDMGCGTGRLAVALAASGHRVTGADPAAAMLDLARARPGGERVTWVEADAASLALDTRFDLIVMTGHAFQHLLEDDAIRAALANLRRHMAPGGRLAFETRNPLTEGWRRWTPDRTQARLDVPGVGAVEVHYDIVPGGTSERVTYETHFRFGPGDVVVTTGTLRFTWPEELDAFLTQAGFTRITSYGDWDRSPLTQDSPEIIIVAA
jgi:SAM-dependent methyltransferase